MEYAKFINTHGSQMIDDTYYNLRLLCTFTPGLPKLRISGAHVALNEGGERVYTYPYLDYLDGKSYTSPDAYKADLPADRLDTGYVKPILTGQGCRKFVGSPYAWRPSASPNGGDRIAQAYVRIMLSRLLTMPDGTKFDETLTPAMLAVGSASPNIVYSLNQYATDKSQGFDVAYARILSVWQRTSSLMLPINLGAGVFSGTDVGYNEMVSTTTQSSGAWQYLVGYRPRSNSNFTTGSFENEVEISPTLFVYTPPPYKQQGSAYNLVWSESIDEYGELIIRRADGSVIFNNRYDYMRVLQYLPTVNALTADNNNLHNTPLRLTFPGRKIAVVATSPYYCAAAGGKGSMPMTLTTGFWFPDVSTVEFTVCVTTPAEPLYVPTTVSAYGVAMAALKNVMVLDVTGCDPWWYDSVHNH